MADISEFTDEYINSFCNMVYNSHIKSLGIYFMIRNILHIIALVLAITIFISYFNEIDIKSLIPLSFIPFIYSCLYHDYVSRKIRARLSGVLINNIDNFVPYAPELNIRYFFTTNSLADFCKYDIVETPFQASYDNGFLKFSFYNVTLFDKIIKERVSETIYSYNSTTSTYYDKVFNGFLFKFDNLNYTNYDIDSLIIPHMKLKSILTNYQEGSLYVLVESDLSFDYVDSSSKRDVIKFFKKQIKFLSKIEKCAKKIVTYEGY